MNAYNILIYGGGNCEIAPFLQASFESLTTLHQEGLRIAAKMHIFANSCVAMYRRLEPEGPMAVETKGGVYSYTSEGDQGIETIELQMQPASDKIVFKAFLEEEVGKLPGEYLLVLTGQGTKDGILLDYFTHRPTYISYESLATILEEVCTEKKQNISLIVDSNVIDPLNAFYQLSRCGWIQGIFFYKRAEKTAIFPIKEWIEQSVVAKEHWFETAVRNYTGYSVNPHSAYWELCKKQWLAYKQYPCTATWKDFYRSYVQIVTAIHSQEEIYRYLQTSQEMLLTKEYLTRRELQQYFTYTYGYMFSQEEISDWLKELKTCIDYYKM